VNRFKNPTLALAGLICILFSQAAPATIVYSESFSYGTTNGPLAGMNGGTGFSGPWTVTNPEIPVITYAPASLTFSDLNVSGGSATATNGFFSALLSRPLTSPLTGVFYGSFLSQIVDSNIPAALLSGMALGPQDSFPVFEPNFYVLTPGGNSALAINAIDADTINGSILNVGQTYLTLFKIDTAAKTATGWVMSSAQYDNLKGGGFTETELDSATLGAGGSQLWARATTTGVQTIPAPTHLNVLFQNAPSGGTGTLAQDELRLSNSSLNEVISRGALDQSFVGSGNLFVNIKEGFDFVGQSFTAGLTGQLTAVRVDVLDSNSSAAPNLRISVFDAPGGVPGSTVLGSITISADHSVIGDSVAFSTPIPVIAGQSYLLAVDYPYVAPGPGQAQGGWVGRSEGGYARGNSFAGNYTNPTTVSWTSNPTHDLFFQTYVIPAPGVPGDYNGNGVVDGADYVVWRDHLGQTFQLPNEVLGITPGLVTADDYNAWRVRFGNTPAIGSSAPARETVPEPITGMLLVPGIAVLASRWFAGNGRR
jgi:hypothetical protein